MQKLLSDALWPQVANLARNHRCFAAIAYVTTEHLRFSVGDVLITDASNAAIASGETSASVLRNIFDRGANVFSLSGLHSKIAVCGEIAIVGSANLSNSNLIEASVCTDDPVTVSQALAFIDRLTGMATHVDQAFLNRISAIKVKRTVRGGRRTADPVQVHGGRAWIISVHHEDPKPGELRDIKRGEKQATERLSSSRNDINWITYPHTNQSRFRRIADEGDAVVQLWYGPNRKRPVALRPSAVLLRQEEKATTRFFIEEGPDIEARSLRFGEFQDIARRAGITARLTLQTTREIRSESARLLQQLWPSP
jgi:hypothetical protein